MSDDTTTWLKKNPAANPLRRSLKTSLRFHVPSSDMNTSIMSNPDKVKEQGLFIPRMLQRSNMQMRKSRASEFKVPQVMAKPVVKKGASGSGVKQKKIPTPNRARKSLLPISKAKAQVPEKVKPGLPRPSFIPGGSARRTATQRELIKKAVELSEIKRREEAESQLKAVAEESSVLRSILKKRASLRRASQISAKKPKAKKVLFDGYENSDGEKENDATLSSEEPNDFNTALDEPTVFLNFPNGASLDESPFQPLGPAPPVPNPDETTRTNLNAVIKLWESYKENLNDIQTERSSLEDSFESLVQHSLSFQKEYQAYKETSEEMYSKLARLGKEIEESLRRVMEGGWGGEEREGTQAKRRSTERRGSEKIKMSERSKGIKKNSGRKSVPAMKRELYKDMEDSFSIISRNNF